VMAGATRPSATSSQSPGSVHTVRRGETLYAIANRNGCTIQALARTNHIRGPNFAIRPGQKLSLAGCRR